MYVLYYFGLQIVEAQTLHLNEKIVLFIIILCRYFTNTRTIFVKIKKLKFNLLILNRRKNANILTLLYNKIKNRLRLVQRLLLIDD